MELEAIIGSPAEDGKAAVDEFPARVAESQRLVFHIAHGVLGNAADAEEVAQDAFLRAFRGYRRLKDPASFRAWVARAAYRLALNRRRAQQRRLRRDAAWQSGGRGLVEDGARRADERLALDRLRREIDRLPRRLRDVVLLSAVAELDAPEVGRILRIPAGTVRSRLHAARKRLLEGLG